MGKKTLRFVVNDITNNTSKNSLPSAQEIAKKTLKKVIEIETDTIKQQLFDNINELAELFASIPENPKIAIDTVSFSVGIDSSGKVALFGLGSELRKSSVFTITMKTRTNQANKS